jgi:hypothetical protein
MSEILLTIAGTIMLIMVGIIGYLLKGVMSRSEKTTVDLQKAFLIITETQGKFRTLTETNQLQINQLTKDVSAVTESVNELTSDLRKYIFKNTK